MRIFQQSDPYTKENEGKELRSRGLWPCKWVRCADAGDPPYITAYRRPFALERHATVRIHVSADERYDLFLDGRRIGRGSERGDQNNWYYESYELTLARGEHVFVARVWSLGPGSPLAQISVYPGFILSPEGDEFIQLFGTGVAPWEAKALGGYRYTGTWPAFGVGHNLVVDGARFSWGYERGEGDGWKPVVALDAGEGPLIHENGRYPYLHVMRPAPLPAMMEEERRVGVARHVSAPPHDKTIDLPVRAADNLAAEIDQWNLVRTGGAVTVPPRTRRRVLIDLENYYCAYPEVVTSGGKGSRIRLLWAESLYDTRPPVEKAFQFIGMHPKGNRGEVEGKYYWGFGDLFLPDGARGCVFDTVWWQCGRYLEIYVETAAEPVTIDRITLRETRYPLEMESAFESSDPRVDHTVPIMVRGLQMCSHETYMDCPYYEQSMYVGDTRLEILTQYTISRDDRLPRKAIEIFDEGRLRHRFVQSRYPTHMATLCPPFSVWWVALVYDYALWRGDREYLKRRMPGVRAMLDGFQAEFIDADGFVRPNKYLNFMDWVPGWDLGGAPPGADDDVNSMLNWQFALVLTHIADLEEYMGERELAARARRWAGELAERITRVFWNSRRGLYAENRAHTVYTEHTQCLAILSGLLDPIHRAHVAQGLLTSPDLLRTTIYFTHYLFETCRALGRIDAFFERLALWFDLEKNGFKTTYEAPEPTRSDCHAWGAHPLYHYFATILGIRPGSMGFDTVHVAPQLGPLTHAKGRLVHPKGGEIAVDLRVEGGRLQGTIALPAGVHGVFEHQGGTLALRPGEQKIA